MLKIVMSKIKYSSFPKLIKLSDSIKSYPHSFCAHHGSIGNYWGWELKHTRLLRKKRMVGTR